MKTTVLAKNKEEAKEIVKDKIIFHKITSENKEHQSNSIKKTFDDIMDILK